MFDLDQFIEACVAAVHDSEPRRAVRDVLARAVAAPAEIAERLQPRVAGITLVHHAPSVTVASVVWAPGMRIFPHDHRMWAAIAVYAGCEDNEFFRRPPTGDRGLVPTRGKRIGAGEVIVLGDDTIHAVANPGRVLTGAIHVYGGDFVNQQRSQWLPPDLVEEPYDASVTATVFAEANAAWSRSG